MMTPRQAGAVTLRDSGMSMPAIAERLGCSTRVAAQLVEVGLRKRGRAARAAEVASIYSALKRQLLEAPLGHVAGALLRAAECPQRANHRRVPPAGAGNTAAPADGPPMPPRPSPAIGDGAAASRNAMRVR